MSIGGRAKVVKKAVAAAIRSGSFSLKSASELFIIENNAAAFSAKLRPLSIFFVKPQR
jgi:hypothetical protein